MTGLILDHTALLALGRGNQYMSGLISTQPRKTDRHLYVPALCLAAAEALRQGLADHVGGLRAFDIIRIRYWRRRRGGMTQQQLADFAGVSQSFISKVEAGEKASSAGPPWSAWQRRFRSPSRICSPSPATLQIRSRPGSQR